MPFKFDTHISISTGITRGQICSPPSRKYVDISASNCDTELIKKQKNPYGELMGGIDTFQSSSYNSFSLKPGRVKMSPPQH